MVKRVLPEFVKLRKSAGLSQKDLATALGVARNTVSRWERGEMVPELTIPQVKRLCDALGVTLDQIPDHFGPQPVEGGSK